MSVIEISNSIFKVCAGIAMLITSFSIYKISTNKVEKEDTTIIIKSYNDNEEKIVQYMDSVASLDSKQQLELFKNLSDKYRKQYLNNR